MRGWRQLLRRVVQHLVTAQLPLFSAGIAFFAVLSIAPVLVTALSVYGAINTPTQAREQLAQVAEMLPTNCNRSSPIISGHHDRVHQGAHSARFDRPRHRLMGPPRPP
jgi:hypothetical protein